MTLYDFLNNNEYGDAMFFDKEAFQKYIYNKDFFEELQDQKIIVSTESAKLLDKSCIQNIESITNNLIIIPYKPSMDDIVWEKIDLELPKVEDLKDLTCAACYDKYVRPDETVFVTHSYKNEAYAHLLFGDDSVIFY